MILACHPYYQCEFEHCWSFMTQKFALAALLSGCVVLVLGVGFPGLLLVELYRRRRALNVAFFGAEYGDAYVSPETRGPKFSSRQKRLLTSEWGRFSAADNSALGQQYTDASYKWLMMPAIALVFKVIVLIPAVFLEPRSWNQRLGSAAVEVVVGAFYFLTNTQLSPVLLLTLRAASVHQVLVLGLQNIDLITQFDSSISISQGLVGITLTYVFFSSVVFLATVALPIFSARRDKAQTQRFLNAHGFDFSSGISLYLDPEQSPLSRPSTTSPATSSPQPLSSFDIPELTPHSAEQATTRQVGAVFDDIQSISSSNTSLNQSSQHGRTFFEHAKRRRSSFGNGSAYVAPTIQNMKRRSSKSSGYVGVGGGGAAALSTSSQGHDAPCTQDGVQMGSRGEVLCSIRLPRPTVPISSRAQIAVRPMSKLSMTIVLVR